MPNRLCSVRSDYNCLFTLCAHRGCEFFCSAFPILSEIVTVIWFVDENIEG